MAVGINEEMYRNTPPTPPIWRKILKENRVWILSKLTKNPNTIFFILVSRFGCSNMFIVHSITHVFAIPISAFPDFMGILFMSWSAFYFFRDWHGFVWFRPLRSPACFQKIVCFAALSKNCRHWWHCQKKPPALHSQQSSVLLTKHCLPLIIRKLSAFALSVRELSALLNCCCTLRKLSAFLYCQKAVCLAAL